MFKSLRNRLLLMNMSFITILLVTAFSIIYFMTWNQVQGSITMELQKNTELRTDKRPIPESSSLIPAPSDSELSSEGIPADKNNFLPEFLPPPKERSLSFSLVVDETGRIQLINSFFTEDDTFFPEALKKAKTIGSNRGKFQLDGSSWAFLIQLHGDNTIMSFVDVTERQALLDRLLITFIIVLIASLLLIFIISFILTQRSIKPIRESFQKQKQFIADASHELKTPLAVIGTNVDLLLRQTEKQENESSKWLKYIKSEVKRMSGLVKDLLDLTRVEDSHEPLKSAVPYNLSEQIEGLLLGMEGFVFEKQLHLKYEVEKDLMVAGNKEQLSQVVITLLDNAVKYSEKDTDITLQVYRQGQKIHVTVSNTGAGISQDDLPYIFDRFYRGDKSRNRDQNSFGLGLAIAQAIVKNHRGTIDCTSRSGELTIFTVKLPVYKKNS